MALPQSQPTITLHGVSGAAYTFALYPWGISFNPVPAVYSVLAQGPAGFGVVYVGETESLSTRFQNHQRQPCFDRKGKTHVAVLVEASPVRRLAIERDVMLKYQPACNREV